MKDVNFGAVSDRGFEMLRIGSKLYPGLVGSDGQLLYDYILKGGKN